MHIHRHAGEVLETTCSGNFLIIILVIWMLFKIHCCILGTALWTWPSPTRDFTDGLRPAGEEEGACTPGSQGARLLYILLGSPQRGGTGLLNPASSGATFPESPPHFLWSGAPQTSKMLCGLLDGSSLWAGNAWEGVRRWGSISKCWNKNGATVGLPHPFWFHVVYLQLS